MGAAAIHKRVWKREMGSKTFSRSSRELLSLVPSLQRLQREKTFIAGDIEYTTEQIRHFDSIDWTP